MEPSTKPSTPGCVRCKTILMLLLVALILTGFYIYMRFGTDRALQFDDPVMHFKYGSTGGDRNMGFPYWVWKALPQVCSEFLPGKGYASLGMLFEAGHDLPVGMSRRHHLGMDRVFLNCAACHTATVRVKADAAPILIAGMPSHQLDLMAFQKFFQRCASSAKFTPERIIPEAQRLGAKLDPLDRYVVYPIAIHLMRDRVIALMDRLRFINTEPDWGPGRVDTFNSAKAIFNFPIERLPKEELFGASDFPAIWNQAKKRGMQLHWDGNNDRVEERNLSASFGTGATPPIIDHAAIERIEAWSATAAPPAFTQYYPVDATLSAKGAALYQRYCADCHGASGSDFSGKLVGQVTPLKHIGTDPYRVYSYSPALMVNQGTLYAGYPQYQFTHFRKTFGYANMPLDGLWLRAPYLHNGSVPTLWALLQPSQQRPKHFYRGNDVYDPQQVGFVSNIAEQGTQRYFKYDTRLPGNGNQGHDGPAYGTALSTADKWALIEYLKTF
ncbi:MAG: cytochrome c [Pseudomonadota bacterium]